MKNEKWEVIKEYPNYEVSNKGNIREKDTKELIGKGIRFYGYEYVMINCEQKYVHRLVAEAFIPNPENKPQVNHINHERNDNRAENLEWVTFAENIKDAWEFGSFDNVIGENHYNTSLTENDVRDIRKRIDNGETGVSIADSYNISSATVTGIKNGRVWSHVD